MKKKKDTYELDKRKSELLKKIEENYMKYLRSQLKKDVWHQDEGLQHEKQSEPPGYQIEDITAPKKTREELIKTILNLRETPLVNNGNIQSEDTDPLTLNKLSKPAIFPQSPAINKNLNHNNSHNKLAFESIELGEEEVIHQIDEEVALQSRHKINQTEKIASSEPTIEAEEVLGPTQPPSAEEEERLYQEGDIIVLDDGDDSTIGIYISPVPDKDYDVVYCLREDGRVEPRGIPFYSYTHRKIGRLPEERLKVIKTRMRWMREEIIYYLDRFEDIKLIPSSNHRQKETFSYIENTTSVQVEEPVEKTEIDSDQPDLKLQERVRKEEPHSLVRGRKIIIKYGDKRWESIYWGADDRGVIVAHKTTGSWELMHLDLTRFGDNVEYGEILSDLELLEIQRHLESQLT